VKILLYTVIGIFFTIGLMLAILSISSRKQPELGLFNGQLRACPASPNCVCSEFAGKNSFVEPLNYSIAHADAWGSVKQAIITTGGELVTEQGAYLHARYVTPLMRYVDDMEMRMDEDAHVIHVRSASRVGHSDMGANRERVERMRQTFDRQ